MKYLLKLLLGAGFMGVGLNFVQLYQLPFFLNILVVILGIGYLVNVILDYSTRITPRDRTIILMFEAYNSMLEDELDHFIEMFGFETTKRSLNDILNKIEITIKISNFGKTKRMYYAEKLKEKRELTATKLNDIHKNLIRGE